MYSVRAGPTCTMTSKQKRVVVGLQKRSYFTMGVAACGEQRKRTPLSFACLFANERGSCLAQYLHVVCCDRYLDGRCRTANLTFVRVLASCPLRAQKRIRESLNKSKPSGLAQNPKLWQNHLHFSLSLETEVFGNKIEKLPPPLIFCSSSARELPSPFCVSRPIFFFFCLTLSVKSRDRTIPLFLQEYRTRFCAGCADKIQSHTL